MANNSHVNRYAKVLFNAAVENNIAGDVRGGLIAIAKIAKSIPEFNHILFTKNISGSDKKNILSNILRGKMSSLVIELLMILIENDEIQLFEDIANKYNYLMKSNSVELDVSITSNVELSKDKLDSMKVSLAKKLDKQINIKNNVDKSLVGGIQLRIGNTIIDNSLSNKLNKLKNNLKNHANME
tara:strand:+ start:1657 stop:2208 length:552 start_codon:yes stop_codon:yes gene_type:complete